MSCSLSEQGKQAEQTQQAPQAKRAPYALPPHNGALVRGANATAAEAAAALVGAGAGLSTAAGLTYSGERFTRHFPDFRDRFGIADMYAGGFFPFPDLETYWAWWSRHIWLNRYREPAGAPYVELLDALRSRDYFVITTNVDHQFQLAGVDKRRPFYTQGDYGLFQCSRNCSGETRDNESAVRAMVERQRDMRVPSELVPVCPRCGAPMVPNLRVDNYFCENEGWHNACARYQAFRREHARRRVLYLKLGVGANTPGIIKYPFWQAAAENERSTYACVNKGETLAPAALAPRSILIDVDIAEVTRQLAVGQERWRAWARSRRRVRANTFVETCSGKRIFAKAPGRTRSPKCVCVDKSRFLRPTPFAYQRVTRINPRST